MPNREEKIEKLLIEIEKSILVSADDKKFWIEHADSLPEVLLDTIIGLLEKRNQIVDEYILAAIEADPDKDYLSELKVRIQQIKKKAFNIEEGAEKKDINAFLEKELSKVDETKSHE